MKDEILIQLSSTRTSDRTCHRVFRKAFPFNITMHQIFHMHRALQRRCYDTYMQTLHKEYAVVAKRGILVCLSVCLSDSKHAYIQQLLLLVNYLFNRRCCL